MPTRITQVYASVASLTLVAIGALLNPSAALGQSCPSRISVAGIRNSEIRRVTESAVVDQAFIDQNGGAELMMAANRQQIIEFQKALRQAEECVVQQSVNPAAVQAGLGNAPSACKAMVEQYQDAIRASEAWMPVLQCWASQGRRGTTASGQPRGAIRAPSAQAIQGVFDALSAFRNGNASAPTVSTETNWNAVQQRVAATEARVRSTCGEAPSRAGLLSATTVTPDGVSVARSAVEDFEARERQYSECSGRVWKEADNEASGVFGGSSPGFQPLLDPSGSATRAPSAATSNAVDAILNAGKTGATEPAAPDPAPTVSIPFEYETPRANRDFRTDFLKRIFGELRSNGTQHEISLHVDDIDGSWWTTDQCVRLDISFQVTLVAPSGSGRATSFPVVTVPVTAPDGTEDFRVPLILDAGRPSAVRVTAVTMRACTPQPAVTLEPACPTSLEDRLQLRQAQQELKRRSAVLETKWKEMLENLNALRAENTALERATSVAEIRTRLSSSLTVVKTVLAWAGGLGEAQNFLVGVAVSLYQSMFEDIVEAWGTLAGAVTEFSRLPWPTLLDAAQLYANELNLAAAKAEVAKVVFLLDQQIDNQTRAMTKVETQLTAINLELGRLEARCR